MSEGPGKDSPCKDGLNMTGHGGSTNQNDSETHLTLMRVDTN